MRNKATKYTEVKFNAAAIVRRYKKGMTVSAIAKGCGYPPNTGNNRVRNVLKKAGAYKPAAKKSSK